MKQRNTLFLLLLCYQVSFAQDSTHNAIQLACGIGNILRQDVTVSPFIHKDWSPVNVLLNYERSKKLTQHITLKFGLYSPKATESYEFTSFYGGLLSTIPHSFKMIDLNYSLGKKWINKNNWTFASGVKSRNFVYASEYYFGASGPSPMMISFGLDAWGLLHYQLNEDHYLSSTLSLPLFSFVYRDPYLTANDEFFQIIYSHKGFKEFTGRITKSKFRSWGNAQRFDCTIQYGYVVNKSWDIGLSYYFSMNFNRNPTKFTQFENVLFIAGKFKF